MITLVVFEVLSIGALLVGAVVIYWPGALLLAGIFGVLATEKLGSDRRRNTVARTRRVTRAMMSERG